MPEDLRRDKGIRTVGCCELISAATADTTTMRAEFLRRRKQTVGPVEVHFVQPKLTLCWFRDNFKRMKAKMDGRGIDVPLAGNSNLWIIPEGVEFRGVFDVGDINACASIFMIRDRLPEEYRSLVTEPVLGFRHDALARGLAELSKELSIQDDVAATTIRPATIIGKVPKLGTLQVGAPGDVSILELVEGPVQLLDTSNNPRAGKAYLKAVQTVREGVPFGRPYQLPFAVN
jgi:hypothetical protein